MLCPLRRLLRCPFSLAILLRIWYMGSDPHAFCLLPQDSCSSVWSVALHTSPGHALQFQEGNGRWDFLFYKIPGLLDGGRADSWLHDHPCLQNQLESWGIIIGSSNHSLHGGGLDTWSSYSKRDSLSMKREV